MGHFKKKKFAQGSNQVNPTGNPRKPFFWKVQLELSYIQKKRNRLNKPVKSYSFLKNTTILLPHPLYN